MADDSSDAKGASCRKDSVRQRSCRPGVQEQHWTSRLSPMGNFRFFRLMPIRPCWRRCAAMLLPVFRDIKIRITKMKIALFNTRFIAAVIIFCLSLASIGSADTVCPAANQNSALVIIDMQPYFLNRTINPNSAENKAKVAEIVQEQVVAINRARAANIPIILIEYEHQTIPKNESDTMAALKTAIGDYRGVKTFKKTTDGMLDASNKYRSDLVEYLKSKQVGTLLVTGANGGACVLASIRGALDGDCSVIAYEKGIADFNYEQYIYPYTGRYNNISPRCPNCSFRPTLAVEELTRNMINVPNGIAPSQGSRSAR